MLTPISHGAFERERLAGVDWSHEATRILIDVAPDSALEVKGRTMQPQPLKLAGEPHLRDRVGEIAEHLGVRLDPRCG